MNSVIPSRSDATLVSVKRVKRAGGEPFFGDEVTRICDQKTRAPRARKPEDDGELETIDVVVGTSS